MIQLKFYPHNKRQIISQTINLLNKGGLIVFPSDTVYGLAVDPTNHQAVQKLFQIKSRKMDKAVSILVADQLMAEKYVRLNPKAKTFYDNFLPGPFTVVSRIKKPSVIDPLIYSINETLGIRIPDFPFLSKLAKEFGQPFTATSANISGKHPHYSVDSFLQTLSVKRKNLIDLVIDAGKLPYKKPSTVVDFSQGELKQGRVGDLSFGKSKKYQSDSPEKTKKIAEDLIKKHYSANGKPLVLALVGDLGAGKTTFCQGIGKHFGINRVNSPTFLISKEYELGKKTFHHIDTYRIEEEQELKDLGWQKMLLKGNIIAIEWAEKVKQLIQGQKNIKLIWLFFEHWGKDKRKIQEFIP